VALRRPGGAEAARVRVTGAGADRRPGGAEHRLRRLDRELEDLLRGHRRVDAHRRVGERAQLHHVLVLQPGDLLHLAVAPVGDLERGERLAEEDARGVEQLGAARGVRLLAQRLARGDVVGLGEVQHAQPRRDRLAAQRVRRAQLALVTVEQPCPEGLLVAVPQRLRGRGGT
jgi:hypothetical protein